MSVLQDQKNTIFAARFLSDFVENGRK